jgi:hypothetical protein
VLGLTSSNDPVKTLDLVEAQHSVEPLHLEEVLVPIPYTPDIVDDVIEHLKEQEEKQIVPVTLKVSDYFQDLSLISLV